MKLLYCPSCRDIFNLKFERKTCSCGKTYGNYIDHINAEYSGGITIGIHNTEFNGAICQQSIIDEIKPDLFYGQRFSAWVIPLSSPTCKKI